MKLTPDYPPENTGAVSDSGTPASPVGSVNQNFLAAQKRWSINLSVTAVRSIADHSLPNAIDGACRDCLKVVAAALAKPVERGAGQG